jgi:hypothetical protein
MPDTPNVTPTPGAETAPKTSADNTKSIITLILGILSLACCGFFSGIPAILVGRAELKAIDEGRSPETNRNLTKIGFILGIVGTALSCLGILAYGAIIAFAVMTSQNTPSSF